MNATMQTNLRGFQDLTKQVVPVTRCTPQAIKRLPETPKLTRTGKRAANRRFYHRDLIRRESSLYKDKLTISLF